MIHPPPFSLERIASQSDEGWRALRIVLWPDFPPSDSDLENVLRRGAAFLLRDAGGVAAGFAEVALRRDYVNGCETSPVGFLEGIYVRPACRRQGAARRLCEAAADWARLQGCSEFASDALLTNQDSHAMHHALGFAETERVVFFRKLLG